MTIEELIEICHQGAHRAEHDYEDTVMVQITKRELWLTALAYLLLSQQAECLADFCSETTERFVELLDIQKPHWRETQGD